MKSEAFLFQQENTKALFNEEHRYCLHLCWKIRKGLDNNIEIQRIKKYTDWFYNKYLSRVFEDEEKYLFPVLGNDNKIVKKALSNHRRLRRLFNEQEKIEKSLYQIEEELERHIRFEERELFNLIVKKVSSNGLKQIKSSHKTVRFVENTGDVFWEV